MEKSTYSIKLSIWSEPNFMGNMSVYYFCRFDGRKVPLFGGIAHVSKKEWARYNSADKCLKTLANRFDEKMSFASYKLEVVTNNKY